MGGCAFWSGRLLQALPTSTLTCGRGLVDAPGRRGDEQQVGAGGHDLNAEIGLELAEQILEVAQGDIHGLDAHRALRAHLTRPKTKTVCRVSHADADGSESAETFDMWPNATAELSRLVEQGYTVTIKRREVPA